MATKRNHGDGGIDQRGPDTFRLRYRVDGRRHSVTFKGTLSDARKELRRLVRAGDTGDHVAPDRLTLKQWVTTWVDAGCPGNRRRKSVGQRTLERYQELLAVHVLPKLGARPLQQLRATEIDALYAGLEGKISARTAHHVHSVLNACIGAAVRTRRIARNPMLELTKIPAPGEANHGTALDESELNRLVAGFVGHTLYAIVATAAHTGARRNELLALRWSDIDFAAKTISIVRTVEETKSAPLGFKEPKTVRGKRTFAVHDWLLDLLTTERTRLAALVAGVPSSSGVDLSLVKLPDEALVFPRPVDAAQPLDLTAPRDPKGVTKVFRGKAKRLGFPGVRFHDLRGAHETFLLDRGVPIHVVAARCGHDPAVLLRSYAKRTKKADTSAADVLAGLSVVTQGV